MCFQDSAKRLDLGTNPHDKDHAGSAAELGTIWLEKEER